ncbi:unnamed protein product [Blepharisma stoltei]|uniref:Uncharacterized protein n=1 Tax=Blepharisma stoltei TaxID=1481888 RepID=A0AAU9KAG7_9CILI|nr:unnamed protein product [Blepharisma stoltei]
MEKLEQVLLRVYFHLDLSNHSRQPVNLKSLTTFENYCCSNSFLLLIKQQIIVSQGMQHHKISTYNHSCVYIRIKNRF